MSHHTNRILILGIAILFLFSGCTQLMPTPNGQPVNEQVATMVATTLTAMPPAATATNPSLTETPMPSPTVAALPTSTLPVPTLILPTSPSPTAKPEYACNIINQRPFDDTKFRRKENFDIRWTIVNTGTLRWPSGTYLEYQSGPQMTKVETVDLPRLKPGDSYNVTLDAVAPTDLDMQVMVWAVIAPGETKTTAHWMCYPYVRIVVVK